MANNPKRSKGVPLGTGPDIFWCQGETVYVRFWAGLGAVDLGVVYDSSDSANAVADFLQEKLELDECVARQLREEYSVENLWSYLDTYLPRSGVVAVQWEAKLRLSSTGLECQLPDARLASIHVEDVISTSIDWRRVEADDVECSPLARFTYSHFDLQQGYVWDGRGRISRGDGLQLLLGDD